MSYDLRGNLTGSGIDSYAYTSENRMAYGSRGGVGANLGYDGTGRLLFTSGAQFTYFDYDGDKLLHERANGVGAIIQRRYVYGPGDDNPLVWYEGAGTTDRRWLHADERGSVVAVTNSSGSAIGINSYDEYGIPASSNVGRFQYTGQSWLPELGLYYYKARIYSPTLGRFMQTDPIGYKDGINWYDYVRGDPVNRTDPSGNNQCRNNGNGTQTCSSNGTVVDNVVLAVRVAYEVVAHTTGLPSMTPPASKSERSDAKPVQMTQAQIEKKLDGATVYRVWGGKSGPNGHSWTPVDPRNLPDPRDNLGLPNVNTAENLTIGRLIDSSGVSLRAALPLDGNRGGAPEILVPDPTTQIQVIDREPFDGK